MAPADIVEALDELVTERAQRGNSQSRYGASAARAYEVALLKDALDQLMSKRKYGSV